MQPLSKVRKNATVKFGTNDVMAKCPTLAVKIAECITTWTNIESFFGVFLGLALHSKPNTTLKMYMALENRAAQLRLIESIAQSELSIEQFDVFAIVMEKYLRPAMKHRDKLAHWCWGHSPDLPNDLLLMSPDEALLAHFEALHKGRADMDDNKIFVVTEKYLARLSRDMRVAGGFFAILMKAIGPIGTRIPQDMTALDRLSSHSGIATHLVARRKRRETPLATPLPPPEAVDPSQPK
jgi:hypothetical protein